jgi:hypothetical protein
MPKAEKYAQNNLNAGELSPLLEGRTDIEKYFASVGTMRNWLPMVQGGMTRRPGWHFTDYPKYYSAKDGLYPGDKKCRLIPFEYGTTQAYVIEVGEQYMRFWMDGYLIRQVTGADLITNGGFPANLGGWTDYSIAPGLAEWDAGVAALSCVEAADSEAIQINVDAVAGTFTRLTGSFITDGFVAVGQTITTTGFTNAGNNITRAILGVTPLVITVNNAGLVNETGDGNERITADLTIGSIGQSIATEEWKTYLLTFSVGADPLYVRIATGAGLSDIVYDVPFSPGSKQLTFVARGATTLIQFISKKWATFGYSILDNVTCKEYAPVEITSPYTELNLPLLKWAQDTNNLFIVHPSHQVHVLTRSSSTVWTLTEMEFEDGPYFEQSIMSKITPSHTAIGAEMIVDGGFDDDAAWTQGANWDIGVTGKATKIAGADNNLSQNHAGAAAEIYRVTYTIDSISGGTLTVGVGGGIGTARAAAGTYTEYITATNANSNIIFDPSAAGVACVIDNVSSFRVITLTADADLWYSGHVGVLWRLGWLDASTPPVMQWGYVKIISVEGLRACHAIVKTTLPEAGTTDAHREGRWSIFRGFPCSDTFHENRLIMGGAAASPQTLWGSKHELWDVHTPGVLDNDPISFTIGSNNVNIIHWLASARTLIIGTPGGEFRATGGNNSPITPSNIDVKNESTNQVADLMPLRIGNAILYIQRAGQQLLEMKYSFDSDSYEADDLTLYSDHLTRLGIEELAYQRGYNPLVWVRRSDGVLLALTYNQKQLTKGWSQQPTDGIVESMAVIPNPTDRSDDLYAIIQRTIDGDEKRFVEYLDPYLNVDCGLSLSSSVAVSEISGLEHLIGETVDIVGDGAVYTSQVVNANGQIFLSRPASLIEIGLHYNSYSKTLRPEIKNQTTMGSHKKWARIFARLYETIGLKLNGEEMPFRRDTDLMDSGIAPYTGDKHIINLGWEAEGKIEIEQIRPLSATVLCIFGDLEIGDN